MITSLSEGPWLVPGVIALFALVIAAGLRFSRRAQAQSLRETDATVADRHTARIRVISCVAPGRGQA